MLANEEKICLDNKEISKIDILAEKYKQIKKLYLSNNDLKTLKNIEQFSNL